MHALYYREKGVERLRVVDASVMLTLVSADLVAPSIMMADKAVDIIKNEHRSKIFLRLYIKLHRKLCRKLYRKRRFIQTRRVSDVTN